MKILKQGRKPTPPECGVWRCGLCGCVFEVEPADARRFRWEDDQRDGTFLFGPCPCCQQSSIGHGPSQAPR
jgi:hypothetical protein